MAVGSGQWCILLLWVPWQRLWVVAMDVDLTWPMSVVVDGICQYIWLLVFSGSRWWWWMIIVIVFLSVKVGGGQCCVAISLTKVSCLLEVVGGGWR